jgi:hypothetical protein
MYEFEALIFNISVISTLASRLLFLVPSAVMPACDETEAALQSETL